MINHYNYKVEWCEQTLDYLVTCDQITEVGTTDKDPVIALSKLLTLISSLEEPETT